MPREADRHGLGRGPVPVPRPVDVPRQGPGAPAEAKDRDAPANGAATAPPTPGPAGPTAGLPLSLAPGGIVHVRLRLEHHHVLFGDYDPLLAVRQVEITLAGATVRDLVPLDREQYLAQPRFAWPEPPEDRRDTRHSVSGPDSLHLEAHIPGHHYYRYPDRPVRYGTPMRLRFSYLVAAGTEGECRVRVAQYKDTPTSWRMLNERRVREVPEGRRPVDPGRARLHHRRRGHHAGPGLPHRRRHRHRRDVDRRRQPRAGGLPGADGAVDQAGHCDSGGPLGDFEDGPGSGGASPRKSRGSEGTSRADSAPLG